MTFFSNAKQLKFLKGFGETFCIKSFTKELKLISFEKPFFNRKKEFLKLFPKN